MIHLIEFVGGPKDGEIRPLDDAVQRLRIPFITSGATHHEQYAGEPLAPAAIACGVYHRRSYFGQPEKMEWIGHE